MTTDFRKYASFVKFFYGKQYRDFRWKSFVRLQFCSRRWGRSVSIVSDYRYDDRASMVRSPIKLKDFSSGLCVQISSDAHPVFYPTCNYWGSFPWR
jgi:hypothetical protein